MVFLCSLRLLKFKTERKIIQKENLTEKLESFEQPVTKKLLKLH